MAKINDIQGIVKFLEKQWFEKTGLIAALVIIIAGEAYLLTDGKAQWWIFVLTLFLSAVFVTIAWWFSRLPPKTPKGKIGFLLSIVCTNDKEGEKLREDFVIPLRRLIKSGKTGNSFHFMELPEHLAKKIIEPDDAQSLRIRSRAHFILYGRVRLRTLEGVEHHIIDIDGLVAHKPISNDVSQAIAQEFSELLPRKVHFPTENDLLSFQFTSEWTEIVAKYIIGIAAAYSGDLNYAENLYTDVLERLHRNRSNATFPVYMKLTERIPNRISALYESRAFETYEEWTNTHDHSLVKQLGTFLEKIEVSRKELPGNLYLQAVYAVLKSQDADQAIAFLKKSRYQSNGTWHYNMAFLYGYKKDMKSAIRHYRQAITFQVMPKIITQIEDFMCWIIQQEPEKYQLNYCLGFFNWKAKGDKIQAAKDFQAFLDAGDKGEFLKERELTCQWLKELE